MKLTLLVGPPGSGKSSYARKNFGIFATDYISQDDQGKEGHKEKFNKALLDKRDIVVDRMNFSKEQRQRYLLPAKEAGYTTEIYILHESYETCFTRCSERTEHPTIKDSKTASKVLDFFFKKYERVTDDEADTVTRKWPEGFKRDAIICDLDGTLCNINHRLRFVKQEKKDWKGFFERMNLDLVNPWCQELLQKFSENYAIVLASGRPDDYKRITRCWIEEHGIDSTNLYMRRRGDFRPDDVVKEIILDFEILTRFEPYFFIDDRQNVVDLWRRRGYTCLQCDKGDF